MNTVNLPNIPHTYRRFLSLMLSHPSGVVAVSRKVPVSHRDGFARALVRLAAPTSAMNEFSEQLIHTEFSFHESSPTSVFRTDTCASKTLSAMTKMYGLETLNKTLGPAVERVIVASNESSRKHALLEIDPSRLEQAGVTDVVGTAEGAQNLLEEVATTIIEYICSEEFAEQWPSQIRYAAHYIRRECEMRGIEKPAAYVGGYIMLRYISAAVSVPEVFGIVPFDQHGKPYDITPSIRRSLVLVSKLLQQISNGVAFGEKEAYMMPLNSFISRYLQRFNDSILEVANVGLLKTGSHEGTAAALHGNDSLSTRGDPANEHDLNFKEVLRSDIQPDDIDLTSYRVLDLFMFQYFIHCNSSTFLSGCHEDWKRRGVTISQRTDFDMTITQFLVADLGPSPLQNLYQTREAQASLMGMMDEDGNGQRMRSASECSIGNEKRSSEHLIRKATLRSPNRPPRVRASTAVDIRGSLLSDTSSGSPLRLGEGVNSPAHASLADSDLNHFFSPSPALTTSLTDLQNANFLYHHGHTRSGDAVVYFVASRFDPDYLAAAQSNYSLAKHVQNTVNAAMSERYVLVVDMSNHQRGNAFLGRRWWRRVAAVYKNLDRKTRKNISKILIIHPSTLTRALLLLMRRLTSSKVRRKIVELHDWRQLEQYIPTDDIGLPIESRQYLSNSFVVTKVNSRGRSQRRAIKFTTHSLLNMDESSRMVKNEKLFEEIQSIYATVDANGIPHIDLEFQPLPKEIVRVLPKGAYFGPGKKRFLRDSQDLRERHYECESVDQQLNVLAALYESLFVPFDSTRPPYRHSFRVRKYDVRNYSTISHRRRLSASSRDPKDHIFDSTNTGEDDEAHIIQSGVTQSALKAGSPRAAKLTRESVLLVDGERVDYELHFDDMEEFRVSKTWPDVVFVVYKLDGHVRLLYCEDGDSQDFVNCVRLAVKNYRRLVSDEYSQERNEYLDADDHSVSSVTEELATLPL